MPELTTDADIGRLESAELIALRYPEAAGHERPVPYATFLLAARVAVLERRMDKDRMRAGRASKLQPIEMIDQGQPIKQIAAGSDLPCSVDNLGQRNPAFDHLMASVVGQFRMVSKKVATAEVRRGAA